MNLLHLSRMTQAKSSRGPIAKPHNNPAPKMAQGKSSKFTLGAHSKQWFNTSKGWMGCSLKPLSRVRANELRSPEALPTTTGLSIQGLNQNELQFAHNQNMGTCLDPSLPFQQPRSTEAFCCQLLKLRVRDHLMKNRSHKSTRQATDNCFKARNCRNCRNRQSCRYHPGKKVANHQSSQRGHSAIVSWLRAKAVHADA